MKKADDLILLGLLYNKIEEKKNLQESVENLFIKKANLLYEQGQISKESLRDGLYAFVPNEREKQIKAYQKQAKTKVDKEIKRAESIIDEVLSDNPHIEKERIIDEIISRENVSSRSSYRSPCDIGSCGRSSC